MSSVQSNVYKKSFLNEVLNVNEPATGKILINHEVEPAMTGFETEDLYNSPPIWWKCNTGRHCVGARGWQRRSSLSYFDEGGDSVQQLECSEEDEDDDEADKIKEQS